VCEVSWLFFEAKRGPRAKRFGKPFRKTSARDKISEFCSPGPPTLTLKYVTRPKPDFLIANRMKFELFTVLQCAVSVVSMIVLLLMHLILFWRLTDGTHILDAKCVKVLSRAVAGRGQLRPSPTRSSPCVFPKPDRTQFPQLVLPLNSQLTTLRAPEVPS